MKASLIAFSQQGLDLARKVAADLPEQSGDTASVSRGFGAGKEDLHLWTKQAFSSSDLLIFVGAAGIAVRAIAPFVRSKFTDPAVLSMDDGARFCIPLLSGHIGGANRYALRVAAITGATPAVTTATDVHGLFAADDWAARHGYFIDTPENIKRVSAALLAGERIGVCCELPAEGKLPAGLIWGKVPPDICVTLKTENEPGALRIIPPFAVLGVGCRKNTPAQAVEQAFAAFCRETKLSPHAFCKVCSIDLKRKEAGILDFCRAHGLPFTTYCAQELQNVSGKFTGSEFVRRTTGVDNVCERAALLGAGQDGKLIIPKTIRKGVTLAAAVTAQAVRFEPEEKGTAR